MDRVPSTEPPSAAATEQLLAHTEWLRRVARALTTNAEDADDVVQQTWLAAIERPPAHLGNLRGWLATLARNLVRSRRRSRERETARTRALPPPPPAPTPAESVARAELQQAVLDAVLALEEPYRATLVQRYCDELSADEIARRSGVPVETVRTRVKRGLDQVRGSVARKLGGEREHLAALLAPLIGGGVVGTGAKVGWFVGIAALVVASTTLVIRIARHEGGARESVAAVAPAGAANETEPALAASRQADAPAPPTDPAAAESAASVAKEFDVTGTVVDSGGAPVTDATVVIFDRPRDRRPGWSELLEMFESPRARRSAGEEGSVRSTTTDVQGVFRLSSVERAHPRCIAAHHPTKGMSESIDVEPPDTNESRPISLALRPGISVQGRIVDADGRRVEHAKLTVSTGTESMMGTTEFDTGSGTFSVPPIPVTELTLTATDDADRHRSTPLTLRADEGEGVREVTLRLDPVPYSVKLHGRVLGPDHEPLVATHPYFRSNAADAPEDARRSKVLVWPVAGETPSLGSAHTYVAVGVTSFDARRGEYTCTAALSDEDDFRPTCLVVEYRDRVVATMPLDEALLEPTDETHEVPDLVIDAPPKNLEPVFATLEVHVVDAATGQPIDGSVSCTILLRFDSGATSKLAGAAGSQRTQRIPPSRASIVASCRGYVADWINGDFAARVEPYSVTVALKRAVRAVRGEVLDPDHKPVAGARVCWLGEKDGSFRGTAVEPVSTDASGRFEFVAVGASRGRVAVEAEHFVPALSDVAAGTEDASAQVELARGVAVTFTASPDANGNEPNGVLQITRADGTIVRDDWDLRCTRFDRPWPKTITLAPGTYRYRVDFVTRADDDGEFTVSVGAEVRVEPQAR
jgi:RNA polymerase sigma-70 factor (ECF subfamily)